MHGVAEQGANKTDRRAPALFSRQKMPSVRCDDVQAQARMVQDLASPAAIESLQGLRKHGADTPGRWPAFAGLQFIVLANVVVLKLFERTHRVVQTRGRHAPGANRCADQVEPLCRLRQPVPENEAV